MLWNCFSQGDSGSEAWVWFPGPNAVWSSSTNLNISRLLTRTNDFIYQFVIYLLFLKHENYGLLNFFNLNDVGYLFRYPEIWWAETRYSMKGRLWRAGYSWATGFALLNSGICTEKGFCLADLRCGSHRLRAHLWKKEVYRYIVLVLIRETN